MNDKHTQAPGIRLGDRYLRQADHFREQRREASAIVELNGRSAPVVSTALKAAAAAAGIPTVCSDYHSLGAPPGHWLRGDHDRLVQLINPEVDYQFLDPELAESQVGGVLWARPNSWLIVHANEPQRARERLCRLEAVGPLPVLLVWTLPDTVILRRTPCPSDALAELLALPSDCAAGPATPEMAVLSAGLIMNEVIYGGTAEEDDLAKSTLVGFYSRRRPRRIDADATAPLDELVASLPPCESRPAELAGRRFKQVGAGALGTWISICLSLNGGVHLEVIDRDEEVEPHNLNRQILFVQHLGEEKAPALAAELAALDPAGSYGGERRSIDRPADLQPLDGMDALILAPDNDEARLVGCDAAWQRGLLCGQGATGATGGQLTVHHRRACFRCVTGINERVLRRHRAGGGSCQLAANANIVATNMVIAGLLVSELRAALAGRPTRNLRLVSDGPAGNRLARMATDVHCEHRNPARGEAGSAEPGD